MAINPEAAEAVTIKTRFADDVCAIADVQGVEPEVIANDILWRWGGIIHDEMEAKLMEGSISEEAIRLWVGEGKAGRWFQ